MELSTEAKLHFARNEGRACKKPGLHSAKDLRKELHKRKMMGKFFRNQEPADTELTHEVTKRDRKRSK